MAETVETIADYLAHVKDGEPLRSIARRRNVQPSTVMRQVRRIEDARSDPFIAAFLNCPGFPEEDEQDSVLEKLSIKGSSLVCGLGMDTAMIVDSADRRLGTFQSRLLGLWTMLNYIHISEKGSRLIRYSPTGNFKLSGAPKQPAPRSPYKKNLSLPIDGLLRRRMISKDEHDAGIRFMTDFQVACQTSGSMAKTNWDNIINQTPSGGFLFMSSMVKAQGEAAYRDALLALGDGLADIVMLTCGYEMGLEDAEKKLGWSARSGKVVLKIALQRLAIYYSDIPVMIGKSYET